ncbi:MBL fold metallo-hydrolase [Prolixibacter denitrificans]|uniref:L-ascorbate metabolism protein UlaG (Beta-lactamase superfamily) n=2 Tax=Prolixibacter denitrificans TaxID=1541063 RepID=A0A2P8CEH2_9BACT|nr:MBL fold metallo-hydrolase [Prolixibacter denitrificans]PSK83289.1 L-ascorbate metabolism protein UlaG (beta-lactamase superfamily) [Prolixibacter denitrificans]
MSILNQPRFGQLPRGERLERIRKSPNYVDGEFRNQHETPVMTSDKSRFKVMLDFMFRKKIRLSPEEEIPVIKTDIRALSPDEDVVIWFGHSSYFIQLKGKTFLVDPVFNSYASPFSFINQAFKSTNAYKADDFPPIDYLIITHDHWDHLDYNTVLDLKPKIKQVICGLGVGQHFESWGFEHSIITELDWYEGTELAQGWQVTATPARHFSGRGLKGNQTLWASFVLQTPDSNLFLGGDGGYDSHFTEIGSKYGPFDLAILEQGQYDKNWNLIHMMPAQVFEAARELRAHQILPVHHSKFALANHPWDEPLNKITENHIGSGTDVLTPRIGEPVLLRDTTQTFSKWWKEPD